MRRIKSAGLFDSDSDPGHGMGAVVTLFRVQTDDGTNEVNCHRRRAFGDRGCRLDLQENNDEYYVMYRLSRNSSRPLACRFDLPDTRGGNLLVPRCDARRHHVEEVIPKHV